MDPIDWKAEAERLAEVLEPFKFIADCSERLIAGESTMVNIDRCRDAASALSHFQALKEKAGD